MDPKSELRALQARMSALVAGAKSAGRELTNPEADELNQGAARAIELKAAIDRGERTAANLAQWGAGDGNGPDTGVAPTKGYVDLGASGVRGLAAKLAAPGIKALVAGGSSGIAVAFDPSPKPLGNTGPAAGLLSFFEMTRRPSASYKFLRQTVRTSNAAVVAAGGTKPTSTYTVAEVPGTLAVIAHLSEYVDKYLLEDNGELEAFLTTELGNGVIRKAETETLAAILGTSGIQTLATAAGYTPAKGFDAIYQAKVLAGTAGYNPDLVILNATDYQTLRLAKDGSQNYYGGSPFGAGDNPGLWGDQTFVSPGIAQGTALVLDSRTVGISIDGRGIALDMDAATGFDKNQVRFRSEGRFATDVKQPAGIVKVTFTA